MVVMSRPTDESSRQNQSDTALNASLDVNSRQGRGPTTHFVTIYARLTPASQESFSLRRLFVDYTPARTT
jgi:hypothetical protein